MGRIDPHAHPLAESAGDSRLYQADFAAWCARQERLLAAGRVADLDLTHLAEEIGDMGRSQRRLIRHRLVVLLTHLLKWQAQPAERGGSWRGTLREQRRRIAGPIQDSPSLADEPVLYLNQAYQEALAQAADETGLPRDGFPTACPWPSDAILDPDFLPEG